ncbi:hypothetical protein G7Y89_g14646 [Cudoniella acicularis]|uniref:F-box domain-containing protein n=1 Tax=Cudoniella acicularis TaxID=354080 RepID=A0A8H4VU93_9HELO|nr:hypothetical protein G7Y89_g14646 [Cudoniella acicularis]
MSSTSTSTPFPLLSLPTEIHTQILTACNPNDRICLTLTCKYLFSLPSTSLKKEIKTTSLTQTDSLHLCNSGAIRHRHEGTHYEERRYLSRSRLRRRDTRFIRRRGLVIARGDGRVDLVLASEVAIRGSLKIIANAMMLRYGNVFSLGSNPALGNGGDIARRVTFLPRGAKRKMGGVFMGRGE